MVLIFLGGKLVGANFYVFCNYAAMHLFFFCKSAIMKHPNVHANCPYNWNGRPFLVLAISWDIAFFLEFFVHANFKTQDSIKEGITKQTCSHQIKSKSRNYKFRNVKFQQHSGIIRASAARKRSRAGEGERVLGEMLIQFSNFD